MAPKRAAAAGAEAEGAAASRYRRLDQREHVLARPGMYIGSVAPAPAEAWLWEGGALAFREATFSPAFVQVFLEILTNATDHAIRTRAEPKAADRVTRIAVALDPAGGGWVSVENNGRGVECGAHPEYGVRVPELVFGSLLTSSNFDDSEPDARAVAGQNGIGAKATNVFSRRFRVETCDAAARLRYSQEWADNMSTRSEPEVTEEKRACKGLTRVSYLPDYERFGMPGGMDADAVALIAKCALDACAVTPPGVRVSLDLGDGGGAAELPCKGFAQYVKMYAPDAVCEAFATDWGEWEVGVAASPEGGLRQVSFVNGLCTPKGGKHADHVANALVRRLAAKLAPKGGAAGARSVRGALWVFVKASVPAPSFDSQNKHCLTSPLPAALRYEPSDAFVRAVLSKTGVAERFAALGQADGASKLKKTDGAQRSTVSGVPKLDDANWAGTKRSRQCTLILTEGDSAKSTAIAGLSVVGRDRFGVFPLRGKLLNVRDAPLAKICDNEEIKAVKKIMGLESGRDYATEADRCALRYGSVLLLTDQDSVTGDTPLLLRDAAGGVGIRAIRELEEHRTWRTEGGDKEYAHSDAEVWTDSGWTAIRRVMRHRTVKRLFRVITASGAVDVTEDHSLLDPSGERVRPGECAVGDRLLHGFPSKRAIRKMSWYGGLEALAGIRHTAPQAFALGRRFAGLEPLGEGVYDLPAPPRAGPGGRVPKSVLSGGKSVRRAFLAGAWDEALGGVAATEKTAAAELYCLCSMVWSGVDLRAPAGPGDGAYVLRPRAGGEGGGGEAVTAVVDLGVTEGYVYDLETENHHFHAGVGAMIVHNTDGFHIKGLVLNLFHCLWPGLARQPGFLRSMSTPIVRARKGRSRALSFYNIPTFEAWRASGEGAAAGWAVKYYKGLGTSTSEDAKEYFTDMRTLDYTCEAPEGRRAAGEGERRVRVRLEAVEAEGRVRLSVARDDCDALDMVFRKGRAEERKRWLDCVRPDACIDYSSGEVSLTDFVNLELSQFSREDVSRSLPGVDGLKVSQRKVLFGAKKSGAGETRVAQLAAYVSQVSAYHHGEASLQQTIVGMAQAFVGAGHVQLLTAAGQFGSRIMGGKDAASPRYIYTQLSPVARLYFPDADEPVLARALDDDFREVEPRHYLPVLPLALLNGAKGIGTGYSTELPCFEPALVRDAYRDRLRGGGPAAFAPLDDPPPCYRGFAGTFERVSPGRWASVGVFARDPKARRVDVTELPVGVWTADYKAFLEDLCADRAAARWRRYESHYTETEVRFSVFYDAAAPPPEDAEVVAELRLRSDRGLSLTNVHLLDAEGKVRRFSGPREVAELHWGERWRGYVARLAHQVAEAERALAFAQARVEFVGDVVDGRIDIRAWTEAMLREHARERRGWPERDGRHDYLFDMPVRSLTAERAARLAADRARLAEALEALRGTTPEAAWLADIDALGI